jgi:hypothetical protein
VNVVVIEWDNGGKKGMSDILKSAENMEENVNKSKSVQATKKEWQTPELRRLPIAATASAGKKIASGNDGTGVGKGDTSSLMS